MSLRSLWTGFKTVVATTLVAGLVWLYAEGENVRTYPIDVRVQFVAPASTPLLLTPREPLLVRLTIRCNAGKLTEVKAAVENTPLRIEIRDEGSEPIHNRAIILEDRLAVDPVFANLGVNIVEAQPSRVDVRAERLVSLTLPIRVDPGGVRIAPSTSIDPAEAKVVVPASLVESLRPLALVARPDPTVLARLDVNEAHTLDVPVTLPDPYGSVGATVTPATAKVILTVRGLTETIVLQSVPVTLNIPPQQMGRFIVDLGDDYVLRDVEVSGPVEAIDRIRSGGFPVRAVVDLTADDLEKAVGRSDPVTASPVITTPTGVAVVAPPPPITFRVTRVPTPERPAIPPTGAGPPIAPVPTTPAPTLPSP